LWFCGFVVALGDVMGEIRGFVALGDVMGKFGDDHAGKSRHAELVGIRLEGYQEI
jgi:hypothetical protein